MQGVEAINGIMNQKSCDIGFFTAMSAGYKTTKERQIYFNGIAISLDLISMGVNLDICLEEPGQSSNIGN